MNRMPRVWLFATMTLLSGPALAAPCGGFTDVDDAVYGSGPDSFCGAVEWMRNRRITSGCLSGLYCPGNNVTRVQMALFMQRLGDRLSPQRLFVDQNPGPVTIQGTHGFVCQSPPIVIGPPGTDTGWPRTAVLHGLVWGLVSAPVTWTADIWYSVDGGANFSFITNFVPQNAATVAGMTQGTTFAYKELNGAPNVGTTYLFAIALRESPDVTTGTGNFTDAACHLMVEIGNRNGATTPFDPVARPTSGGLLGANAAP